MLPSVTDWDLVREVPLLQRNCLIPKTALVFNVEALLKMAKAHVVSLTLYAKVAWTTSVVTTTSLTAEEDRRPTSTIAVVLTATSLDEKALEALLVILEQVANPVPTVLLEAARTVMTLHMDAILAAVKVAKIFCMTVQDDLVD